MFREFVVVCITCEAEVFDDDAALITFPYQKVWAVVRTIPTEIAFISIFDAVLEERVCNEFLAKRLHVFPVKRLPRQRAAMVKEFVHR